MSSPTPIEAVIGIDPGYERLGVAVLAASAAPHLIESFCIRTSPRSSHAERLLSVAAGVGDVLSRYPGAALAVEKLYFSKNAKTALLVAEARGVILCEAARAGVPIYEYNPAEVKIAVTGHGGSDKVAVEAMVRRLVPGIAGDRLDDEFDAIALALTFLSSDFHSVRKNPLAKKQVVR